MGLDRLLQITGKKEQNQHGNKSFKTDYISQRVHVLKD